MNHIDLFQLGFIFLVACVRETWTDGVGQEREWFCSCTRPRSSLQSGSRIVNCCLSRSFTDHLDDDVDAAIRTSLSNCDVGMNEEFHPLLPWWEEKPFLMPPQTTKEIFSNRLGFIFGMFSWQGESALCNLISHAVTLVCQKNSVRTETFLIYVDPWVSK